MRNERLEMNNRCIAPTRRSKNTNKNPDIIILGADICYGMKSYGPQSLLKVNNKPIIEHQLEVISQTFPKSDVILVAGFDINKIVRRRPTNVRIVENPFFSVTNETEQLRLAFNCSLSDSVIILTDGIVFNKKTMEYLDCNNTCVLYDSKNQLNSSNVGINVVDGCAKAFVFDSPNKWCHITHLAPKEYKIVKNLCNTKENINLFFSEILNKLVEKTNKIVAIEPPGMIIAKINNSKDLVNIQ